MALFKKTAAPLTYMERLSQHNEDGAMALDMFNHAAEQLEIAAEGLEAVAAEAKAEAEQHQRWADHAAISALHNRNVADRIRNFVS